VISGRRRGSGGILFRRKEPRVVADQVAHQLRRVRAQGRRNVERRLQQVNRTRIVPPQATIRLQRPFGRHQGFHAGAGIDADPQSGADGVRFHLLDVGDRCGHRFRRLAGAAQQQVQHHRDPVGSASRHRLGNVLAAVGLAIGGQHRRMCRIAGKVQPHASGAPHALGQLVGKRDDGHIGVPADAVAQSPLDQRIANGQRMLGR
jgi:hypothetical protein